MSISQKRFRGETLESLRNELNDFAAQLQNGTLMLRGVKFEIRPAVPSGPPTNDAWIVLVAIGSAPTVYKLYIWDKSSWQVVGQQT